MRGMKGQWEQEIDWQGTLRDKARQQQKQQAAKVWDNINREKWQEL